MEIACTSQVKQWGIPGEAKTQAPVLSTSIHKRVDKVGFHQHSTILKRFVLQWMLS